MPKLNLNNTQPIQKVIMHLYGSEKYSCNQIGFKCSDNWMPE